VFVRILILWGLACSFIGIMGTPLADTLFGWLPSFHSDPVVNQFYFLRFMLGFFEGGFFPAVIMYLAIWFRPADRAKAIATFMAAIPVSLVIGSPLSGLILEHVQWLGLPGWRWVFILQGVVPILVGFVTIFFLPDRPEKAAWLPAEERDWLLAEFERERLAKQHQGHGHWVWLNQAGNVLLLTGYYFCMNITSYGLTSSLPKILKSQTGASDLLATVLTGMFYLMALVAMLFNGWHSDRTRERIFHAATPLTCLGLGLVLAGWLDGVWILPALVMILFVGTVMYAHLPAFWPIPTVFLGAVAAASAIGFINMIGNLGGGVGAEIVGQAKQGDSYAPVLFVLAPFPFTAAVIILFVGYLRRDRLRAARTGV
jgi:MFS family permease